MKKLVLISLIIFSIATTAILAAGLINYENKKTLNPNISSPSGNNPQLSNGQGKAGANGQAPGSSPALTLAEVAKHNTLSDCWMVIDNKVYDFSPYLALHPGGAGAMGPYCGGDGSQAYQTKDLNPANDHSQTARAMLASYYLGNLGVSLAAAQAKSSEISSTLLLEPTSPVASASSPANSQPLSPGTNTAANSPVSLLDAATVAKHSSISDCWMIISGKVYNLTSYFGAHPGGSEAMAPYCGKDGSQAYSTKDKSSPVEHSAYAHDLLAAYYIGNLGSPIDTRASQPAPTATVPATSDATEPTSQPQVTTPVSPPATTNVTLSLATIALHNTQSDCWMIIDNKVYNLTSYFGAHPGGSTAMAPYCGQDGSQAYSTKDKSSPQSHSAYAQNLLAAYYIGDVGQAVSTPSTTPPPPPASLTQGGDDDEHEDEHEDEYDDD